MDDPAFANAYRNDHVGGLLAQLLFPPLGKFGEFCLVMLALGIVGSNCPNIYSLAFNLQVLARQTQRMPRFVWTIVGTFIYCGIAIAGYFHFEAALENLILITVRIPGRFKLIC
jgi:purine-cytosine permease-like protein